MNKTQRCFLHLRCIGVKVLHGKDCSWHWEHIAREFGFGALGRAPSNHSNFYDHVIPR